MGILVEWVTKWGGTPLFFFGSLLFATTQWAGNEPMVFVLFLLGHLIWVAFAIVLKDRGFLLLNLMYVAFDLSAIWIRL